jgi:formamidopyrimidine-DNA glycosylase
LSSTFGQKVTSVERLGKRIVICLGGDLFVVIHLMIAGRLHWYANETGGKATGGRVKGLVAFEFSSATMPTGTLVLTEAGSKRRAALHVIGGREGLATLNRGGLEVLGSTEAAFAQRLISENHTLKRALTDPRFFSGIGNAYSDEILHRAKLSPIAHTHKLTAGEVSRLHRATNAVLSEWVKRLREETGDAFPEKVTAFRPEMAVHGRYKQPCPVCGSPIQRIVYADNETNYCATCQTKGVLLADRALSRLLKSDWPRSLEEQDELLERHRRT